MKVFLDTSVFVAAFWGDHPQHPESVRLIKAATRKTAFCAAHTVAEVYSAMTRLPVKPPIPTEQALLFIRQLRERFTVVELTSDEYFETVERLAEKGFAKKLHLRRADHDRRRQVIRGRHLHMEYRTLQARGSLAVAEKNTNALTPTSPGT